MPSLNCSQAAPATARAVCLTPLPGACARSTLRAANDPVDATLRLRQRCRWLTPSPVRASRTPYGSGVSGNPDVSLLSRANRVETVMLFDLGHVLRGHLLRWTNASAICDADGNDQCD
jgi:hypothetical protein